MMLPTHAVAGMALALPYALAVPEFGGVALLAGFLGGILPDLDMYVGHRKTLHYPIFYTMLAVAVTLIALLAATTASVALAFVLLAAAVHSLSDVLGGGLELRPWEGTSDRAVYDHYRGRWLAPRRWVRYDGAPEDLILSVALAVPLLVVVDGALESLVFAALAVGTVYTPLRRHLPTIAERVVDRLVIARAPAHLVARVPDRYLDLDTDRATVASAEDR